MTVFILSFVILLLLVAGMAIGSIMGRGPIKGSCGGMGALGIDTACDICGGDPNKCDEENDRVSSDVASDLAYDATQPKA
ncbi:MAG: (Na+)-NQR maturation NqrM [Pseudomonadales bacterium]